MKPHNAITLFEMPVLHRPLTILSKSQNGQTSHQRPLGTPYNIPNRYLVLQQSGKHLWEYGTGKLNFPSSK